MLNKIKFATLLVTGLSLSLTGIAQTRDISINIQSPNVAVQNLFGQYKVSHFTGLPEIGVSLYTLKDKDILLPISLSYHASGIRPDMHPGWVGLNWSLSAGGNISRTVKGSRADDFNNPDMDLGANAGYYFSHNLLNTVNWNETSYMRSVELMNLNIGGRFFPKNKELDTEPDEFIFNFLNYSGKFLLGADGNWKVQCDKPVKVIFNNQFLPVPFVAAPMYVGTDYCGYFPSFSGFTIITEDGTQYVFGGTTSAIEYSVSFFKQSDQWVANSWNLVKIISSNNVTTADLTYEPDDYINQLYDISANGASNTKDTDPSPVYKKICQKDESLRGYAGNLIRPVYLKKIETKNYKIIFNRSTSTELRYEKSYYGTLEGQQVSHVLWDSFPFLEGNTQKNPYPDQNPFPACLDKLQWKELNQILVQDKTDGLIKGYNFNYNNKAYERLTLNSLNEFGSDLVAQPPYSFSYIQPATHDKALPTYLAEQNDHFGFYNGTYAGVNDPDYHYQNYYYDQRESNAAFMQVGTLNKITYPTGGVTEFTYEANDYSKQLNQVRSSGFANLGITKVTGGLRIKKISSYDPSLLNSKIEKEYFYVSNYNTTYTPGNTSFLSSGVLGGQIQYLNIYQESSDDKPSMYILRAFESSRSVLPGCNNSQGSHIGYSEVVEKLNDGSYTKFKFSNFDNGYLDEATVNLQFQTTAYDPFSSTEQERGNLLSEEAYNAAGTLVRSNVATYTALNKSTEWVPALHGRSFWPCDRYDPGYITEGTAYKVYTYSVVPSQETETIFDLNGANPLVTVKKYYYDNLSHKQLTRSEITDSKNRTKTIVYHYPADMVTLGQTTPYQEMVDRNMVSPIIEQITKLDGIVLKKAISTYSKDAVTNLILPAVVQGQYKTNPIENRISYLKYNASGNLLSMSKDAKTPVNYIWSFYGLYPVAKVENADYTTVQSVLGGEAAITAFANSSPTEAQIVTFLAPLRSDLTLKNAFVTSYKYTVKDGPTVIMDSKGSATNYFYDNFQRLSAITNINNDLVKKYIYQIARVDVGSTVYKNNSQAAIFYTTCGGFALKSRPVLYTVPIGAYTSTVSQADADNAALNDLNNNGQTYTNAHYTCFY